MKTFYVHVFNRWVQRGRSGRWSVAIGVSSESTSSPNTVAIYEVRCANRTEAPAVVMAWLARGKPRTMDLVKEVMST